MQYTVLCEKWSRLHINTNTLVLRPLTLSYPHNLLASWWNLSLQINQTLTTYFKPRDKLNTFKPKPIKKLFMGYGNKSWVALEVVFHLSSLLKICIQNRYCVCGCVMYVYRYRLINWRKFSFLVISLLISFSHSVQVLYLINP